MTWLNVGCGTHLAPPPWINTDTRETDNTHPDVIVPAGDPFPFDDGSCDRVMLSHVLEHVPWPAVPGFLAEVRRVLDGQLLVVGPDTHRTLNRWKRGEEPWWLVESVLEHARPPENDHGWPEASHHWNCEEGRVLDLLSRAGFTDLHVLDVFHIDDVVGDGWPVVSPAAWQFAMCAR